MFSYDSQIASMQIECDLNEEDAVRASEILEFMRLWSLAMVWDGYNSNGFLKDKL